MGDKAYCPIVMIQQKVKDFLMNDAKNTGHLNKFSHFLY